MNPLLAYRVLANVVGVVLLLIAFVGLPLHYLADKPGFNQDVTPVHGGLYMVLVGTVIWLGLSRNWPVKKIVLTAIGGTVPIWSFVVERRIASEDRASATV